MNMQHKLWQFWPQFTVISSSHSPSRMFARYNKQIPSLTTIEDELCFPWLQGFSILSVRFSLLKYFRLFIFSEDILWNKRGNVHQLTPDTLGEVINTVQKEISLSSKPVQSTELIPGQLGLLCLKKQTKQKTTNQPKPLKSSMSYVLCSFSGLNPTLFT